MSRILPSSETQGRSVGPGEKARQKFSSTLSSRLLTRPDWQPLGLRGWNSPNPSRVYIRLCKHGKRFLLLKSIPQGNVWRSVLRICKWIVGLKGIIQARIHTGFHRFTSLRTADVSPRLSPLRNVSRGGTSFLLARNVPQRRWARRNVCRSQATVLRKSVRFFIINILYYKKKNFPGWNLENGLENVFSQFPGIRHAMRFLAGKSLVNYPVWMTRKPRK